MFAHSRKKIEGTCVFCEILETQKEKIIYEDERLFAFYDKKRLRSKEHILVCPKKHIADADSLTVDDIPLVELMHKVALKKLQELQPGEKYRLWHFFHPTPNTLL